MTWANRRRDHAAACLAIKSRLSELFSRKKFANLVSRVIASSIDRRSRRSSIGGVLTVTFQKDQRSFQPAEFKPALQSSADLRMRDSLSFTELELDHSTQNDVIVDDAKHRHRVSRISLEKTSNLSFIQWVIRFVGTDKVKQWALRLLNWLQLLPSVTSFMTFNNSLIQLDNQRELFRLVKLLHWNVSTFSFVFWRFFLATEAT